MNVNLQQKNLAERATRAAQIDTGCAWLKVVGGSRNLALALCLTGFMMSSPAEAEEVATPPVDAAPHAANVPAEAQPAPASTLSSENAAAVPAAPAGAEVPTELVGAKDLFVAKCTSCHSVGKGDRVGPDLKGVHGRRDPAWLKQIVQAPSTLLDSNADARALLAQYKDVRMPDLGLSAEQVAGILDLLRHCSDNICELAAKFRPVTEASADDIALGRNLYLGVAATKNGGPSCISCHTVAGESGPIAGGTLARELTHSIARLGDEGLDAALRNPAFPVMNKIFSGSPLSESEAFALRAYLNAANKGFSDPVGARFSVPLVSVLAAIASLIILNAFWSRRMRGVRRPLVSRERLS